MTTLFPSPRPLSEEKIESALAGKNICLLDDEQDPIDILSAYLRRYNTRIDGFTDPTAAMAHLKERRPDILLLDVMMPGIDGWDFYNKVRKDARLANLPVLFVTCLADHEIEPEMEEGHLCATLSKPVDRKLLIHKIVDLLD